MIDLYECHICLISVFNCKHKESKGVWRQLEARKTRSMNVGLLLCTGSQSERIWNNIDDDDDDDDKEYNNYSNIVNTTNTKKRFYFYHEVIQNRTFEFDEGN
jgi:hypothetical protein